MPFCLAAIIRNWQFHYHITIDLFFCRRANFVTPYMHLVYIYLYCKSLFAFLDLPTFKFKAQGPQMFVIFTTEPAKFLTPILTHDHVTVVNK